MFTRLLAALTAFGAVLAMSACGSTSRPPVTVLIVDTSGSTAPLRAAGTGQFQADARLALRRAAETGGAFWARSADGQALTQRSGEIRVDGFTSRVAGGNKEIARADIDRQAARMYPRLDRLVHTTGRANSDLLGALQNASRVLRDYPDRRRSLILLSDGGIKIPRLLDVYRTPLTTGASRRRMIARLRRAGAIGDLGGGKGSPVRVWISGLGAYVDDRATAEGIIAFWRDLIAACGGVLVSEDTALRLVDFPG